MRDESHQLLRQRGLSILREILPKKKIQEIARLEYPQERKQKLTSVMYFGLLVLAQIQKSISSVDELLATGLDKIREVYRIKKPLITKQAFSARSKALPWQIFQRLYEYLRKVASEENIVVEDLFQDTYSVKVLDSSLLDVVARLMGVMASYPSRRFFKSGQSTKGQIKLKAIFNRSRGLPELIHLSKGLSRELRGVKGLVKKTIKKAPAVILVFDLGFFSYDFLNWLVEKKISFVSRIKSNTRYEVIKQFGRHEWLVKLGITAQEQKPVRVRLVRVKEKKRWYYYITNLMDRKRMRRKDIRLLYRYRWQIEIFFKELKHILNIKQIFFYNANGVKGQIYVALSVYILGKILIAQSAQKHGVKAEDISFARAITALRIWLSHNPKKIFSNKPRKAVVNTLLDKIFTFAYLKKKRQVKPQKNSDSLLTKEGKDVA